MKFLRILATIIFVAPLLAGCFYLPYSAAKPPPEKAPATAPAPAR